MWIMKMLKKLKTLRLLKVMKKNEDFLADKKGQKCEDHEGDDKVDNISESQH